MRKIYLFIVTALVLFLIVNIVLAGRSILVGNQYYGHAFYNKSASQVYQDGTKRFIAVDQQFYFNSTNKARSSVDYRGYAQVWLTLLNNYSGTALDSCYLVYWMTDYRGRRTPTNDSVVFGPFSLNTNDTLVFRVSDSTLFGPQPGMFVRFKRQTVIAAADSHKVGIGCLFN